jgi:hypothetical protein
MARKDTTDRDAQWVEAKRKCRLNAEALRRAKELGLSPRSLLKNRPNQAQSWKAPVHVWIREMYAKRMAKAAQTSLAPSLTQTRNTDAIAPDAARTIELRLPPNFDTPDDDPWDEYDTLDLPAADLDFAHDEFTYRDDGAWPGDAPPSRKKIAEQNRVLLERQEEFRIAAEYVAGLLSHIPTVRRVVLFGSVAARLKKEIPRFREFRRAGVAVWHECKDVDLAVWVDDLNELKRLQRARTRALNDLLRDRGIGVAHHQVEIFVFEPGTDRYVGRLCCFRQCPNGKPECAVSGCGAMPFLRQHHDFTFQADALAPERTEVLYDRDLESNGEAKENEIPF